MAHGAGTILVGGPPSGKEGRQGWSGLPAGAPEAPGRPGSPVGLVDLPKSFRGKMFRGHGGVAQLVEQGTFNP